MATKQKWQIEAEKREVAEKELAALKERIPKVLADCVNEYGLDLCDDGLDDFCQRLGTKWEPEVDTHLVIDIYNINLPGQKESHYGVIINDDTLEQDLMAVVARFLTDRFPNASWDNDEVTFNRA